MSKRNAAGLALLSIGALGLAVIASICLARGDLAWGSDPTTVSIGSGHGPQDGSVAVPLEVLNAPAPGVSAVTADIAYDPSVVQPTAWQAGSGWDMVLCSLNYGPSTVRCTALSTTGRSGNSLLANITFHLVGAPSQCSLLNVQIVTFTDSGGNPIPVTDRDGQMCIDGGSVTPTLPPTATFTATPTPSVTPEAAVRVGSDEGPQSSSVTVPLEILDVPAPGVAAATMDIAYNSSVVDPTAWEAGPGWDMVQCNLDYAANTVRCTALSVTGRSGNSLVANITFHLVGSPGQCSPLDVTVPTFTDPGGNPIPVTPEDGELCVEPGGAPVVRIGSDCGSQSSSVTVPLEVVTPLVSPPLLVGAATVDIAYDPAVVDPTAWEAGPGWDMVQCNLDYAANTVRCTALSVTGRSGNSLVANITFHLVGSSRQCSPLDVTVPTFTDPGGNPIPVTHEDGQICVGPCDGVRVFVDPPAEGHYIGCGPIQADVSVEGVTNLGTFDITLNVEDSQVDFSQFALGPFLGSTGRDVSCIPPVVTAGSVRVTCYSTDTGTPGPSGSGLLGTFEFAPTFRLVANTDPSCTAISLDRRTLTFDLTGAQLGDTLGSPIAVGSEEDGTRTVVALPGDVSNDCDVDGLDIQYVAGRWPSPPLPYDQYADIQPAGSAPTFGDGDIDGLDIQFVAGRWPQSRPPSPPVICTGLAPLPAEPAVLADATVRVVPDSQDVPLSAPSFDVAAAVENVTNLGTFDLTLGFDDSLIDFQSFAVGSFLESTGRTVNCQAPVVTSDSVRVTCYTTDGGTPGPNGSGTLGTFTLGPVAEGISPLEWPACQLGDPLANEIPAVCVAGSVTIVEEPTPTYTPTPTHTPTPTATVCAGDADCDGVPDSADNCPFVPNPGQENTDAAIDNGPGIPGDDATVPNAVADSEGDACETDGDIDNDGLSDAQDTNPLGAGICAAFAGASDGHPHPAGGDVTNDDDHDGDPALAMGTDAADNGPSWDTDDDGALDGVECTLGTNPRERTERPNTADCGGTGDTDGDGLKNAWETCGWGTSPTVVDSDGDGKGDCKEAADVDGNGLVNFVGDTVYYAQAVLLPPADFGKTMDFDIDKNGLVTFTGDVLYSAQFALITGLCK